MLAANCWALADMQDVCILAALWRATTVSSFLSCAPRLVGTTEASDVLKAEADTLQRLAPTLRCRKGIE